MQEYSWNFSSKTIDVSTDCSKRQELVQDRSMTTPTPNSVQDSSGISGWRRKSFCPPPSASAGENLFPLLPSSGSIMEPLPHYSCRRRQPRSWQQSKPCLLYTSDAADERSSV